MSRWFQKIENSPRHPRFMVDVRDIPVTALWHVSRGCLGEVGVMKFGLNEASCDKARLMRCCCSSLLLWRLGHDRLWLLLLLYLLLLTTWHPWSTIEDWCVHLSTTQYHPSTHLYTQSPIVFLITFIILIISWPSVLCSRRSLKL